MSVNFFGLELFKYEATIDSDVVQALQTLYPECESLDELINELLRERLAQVIDG